MEKNTQVWNFMNAFIDEAANSTDEEYQLIEDRYTELFGHVIPREMMPSSISNEALKLALLRCIDTKRDDLLELLGVETNPDYLY